MCERSEHKTPFYKLNTKLVRWRLSRCFSILVDFSRFSYGKVIQKSDCFEQTIIISFKEYHRNKLHKRHLPKLDVWGTFISTVIH